MLLCPTQCKIKMVIWTPFSLIRKFVYLFPSACVSVQNCPSIFIVKQFINVW
ncbi:hypothetical protein DAI22_07g074000 [Oryza sativa Japonica Group]|nr:hypothetical protein DAI22_07g074000 [Oryza sativa Japonica Group]